MPTNDERFLTVYQRMLRNGGYLEGSNHRLLRARRAALEKERFERERTGKTDAAGNAKRLF